MKKENSLTFLIAMSLSACNILPNQSGIVVNSTGDSNVSSATTNDSVATTTGSFTVKGVIFSCKSLSSNRCPAVSIKVDSGNNARHIVVKNEHDYPRSIGKFSVTFKGCQAVYSTQCHGNAGDIVDVEIRNEDTKGPVGVNVRFRIPENDQLAWNYDGS